MVTSTPKIYLRLRWLVVGMQSCGVTPAWAQDTSWLLRECAKGHGRTNPCQRSSVRIAGLVGSAFVLTSMVAIASGLPNGGQIVAGSGTISGSGNTVNFVQPSASSVALNRVLGPDVSVIQRLECQWPGLPD